MRRMVTAVAMGLLLVSCTKSTDEGSSAGGSPGGAGSEDPLEDYSKPYLTEAKVTRLLDSMKDEDGFARIAEKLSQPVGWRGVMGQAKELDAFARRYEFKDFQEYVAVWGRVWMGWGQEIGGQAMNEGRAYLSKSIEEAEAALKKPDLTPEMREMYEAQIAAAKEAIDDMEAQKSDQDALSEKDMAIVRKLRPQIEAAMKSHQELLFRRAEEESSGAVEEPAEGPSEETSTEAEE